MQHRVDFALEIIGDVNADLRAFRVTDAALLDFVAGQANEIIEFARYARARSTWR